jgi:hypothetical protein
MMRIVRITAKFDITVLGTPTKLLGMRIVYNIHWGTIALGQEYYINEILERFNMVDCNAVDLLHAIGVYMTT